MKAKEYLIERGDGEGSEYTTDYVEILMTEFAEQQNKELSRHEAFTVVRPYMAASGKVVTKGVELRAKIESLKTNKKWTGIETTTKAKAGSK